MLAILLGVLKVIGILLLILLCLILLIVSTVLVVPVRYEGKASWLGRPEGSLRISWLMRALSVRLTYDGDKSGTVIRVFGIRLGKRRSSKKKRTRARKRAGKAVSETEEKPVSSDAVSNESVDAQAENKTVNETAVNETAVNETAVNETAVNESAIDKTAVNQIADNKNAGELKAVPDGTTCEDDAAKPGSPSPSAHISFFAKIKNVFQRIKNAIQNFKFTVNSICDKLVAAKDKAAWFWQFLNEEPAKKALAFIKLQCGGLFRHLKPKKFQLTLHFGFEDPAMTGQVLAAVSMFYGWYCEHVDLYPDFEQAVLEGNIYIKGRIRAFSLLIIGVKLLLNRNLRKVYKGFRQQEAL